MLTEIFKKPKPLLGKVQVLALPGAPGWSGNHQELLSRAEQEATALATGGVDGLIVENFHDKPYTTDRMDVAGAIAMAMLIRRVRQLTKLPVGLSILQNDPETALAIAINTQAEFIRMPLLAGALLTESGVIQSRMNALEHYKSRLKADMPFLLVDVSVNHILPAGGMGDAGGRGNRISQLQRLIRHLMELGLPNAAIVPDRDILPEELNELRQTLPHPVLIELLKDAQQAVSCFDASDGLILDAGTRKSLSRQPGLPPTIDMIRVEELVNTLRKVVPVTEMDPDIFLQR